MRAYYLTPAHLGTAVVPEEVRPTVCGADQFWLSFAPGCGACLTFLRHEDGMTVHYDLTEAQLEVLDSGGDLWGAVQPEVFSAFATLDAILGSDR